MKPGFLILLLLCNMFLHSQETSFTPEHWTVLSEEKAAGVFRQCSRSVPDSAKLFFTPSDKQVSILHHHFQKLLKLKATRCCIEGVAVKNLQSHAYQYVGVIIRGKKYLYINALSKSIITHFKDWRSKPIMVCDGGTGFWGVLFDLQAHTFSQLNFNGSA